MLDVVGVAVSFASAVGVPACVGVGDAVAEPAIDGVTVVVVVTVTVGVGEGEALAMGEFTVTGVGDVDEAGNGDLGLARVGEGDRSMGDTVAPGIGVGVVTSSDEDTVGMPALVGVPEGTGAIDSVMTGPGTDHLVTPSAKGIGARTVTAAGETNPVEVATAGCELR